MPYITAPNPKSPTLSPPPAQFRHLDLYKMETAMQQMDRNITKAFANYTDDLNTIEADQLHYS